MKSVNSFLTGLAFLITGCSGTKVEDYSAQTPILDIRQYLNGDIEATGVYVSRAGKADPYFHVTMKGNWVGNEGTFTEHFTYSDGKKDDRVWKIHFTDDHHFTGTAPDVVGTASGAQYGNAANLKYTLRVPHNDTTYDIAMDDWLYLVDDHTIINHTHMSKFGFKVGELIITFRKK